MALLFLGEALGRSKKKGGVARLPTVNLYNP